MIEVSWFLSKCSCLGSANRFQDVIPGLEAPELILARLDLLVVMAELDPMWWMKEDLDWKGVKFWLDNWI